MNLSLSHKLFRWQGGIKLIQPDLTTALNQYGQDTGYTVSRVLDLPFNFYFLNTQGQTVMMNQESALACGFSSAKDSVGKSLYDVSLPESAKSLIDNCTHVMEAEVVEIFNEQNIKKDGTNLSFLSIKSPWYDMDNHIIGVFGCSIVLGQHDLATSLASVICLGLFDSEKFAGTKTPPIRNLSVNLSKREIECLQLAIKGYTAKKIAKTLGISHRTVEEYLLNIRVKTGAGSKAELIELFQ